MKTLFALIFAASLVAASGNIYPQLSDLVQDTIPDSTHYTLILNGATPQKIRIKDISTGLGRMPSFRKRMRTDSSQTVTGSASFRTSTGVTAVVISASVTTGINDTLPPAIAYNAGDCIQMIAISALGVSGVVTMRRVGSDQVNGATSASALVIGSHLVRICTDGSANWAF